MGGRVGTIGGLNIASSVSNGIPTSGLSAGFNRVHRARKPSLSRSRSLSEKGDGSDLGEGWGPVKDHQEVGSVSRKERRFGLAHDSVLRTDGDRFKKGLWSDEHVRELVMKAAAASTSINRSLTTGLVLELVNTSSRVSMNLRELI